MVRAVVIGGGVAGVSISRCLAEKGVAVTLLEKSTLTAGATWHAAGLVTRFGPTPKLKKLHVRSLEILTELEAQYGIGLHSAGSIRIIEKDHKDRFLEANHHVSMASLYDHPDYPTKMIDTDEIKRLHPLIDVSGIECAIWTPDDGDVDPTSLTNCLATLAKNAGATFKLNSEVTDLKKMPNGLFQTTTVNEEQFESEIVVNAAGLWSRHVSEMVGLHHPAFVVEHQYAITESLPEIEELGHRLPVLRDLKGSQYIRQERNGLLVGPYEQNCKLTDWGSEPPKDWGMELFPDEMTRLEDNLMHAIELIPAMGNVGFINCTNGPTIWAGDGAGRIGRSLIPGLYDFNTQSYGIAQSPPLAEYLRDLILDGEQPFDLSNDMDPLRYGPWATDGFVREKILETYAHNNRVSYPFENRSGGRSQLAQSPVVPLIKAHGGVLHLSKAGVELPVVFYPEQGDQAHCEENTFVDLPWHQKAVDEANMVLENVGLGFAAFSQYSVKGPGAQKYLDHLTTNTLPAKDGRCKLTYALTPKGRLLSEFTVARITDQEYFLMGSRDLYLQDWAWLNQHAPEDQSVELSNLSCDLDVLHVAGPNTVPLLSEVFGEDMGAMPFMGVKTITKNNVPIRCIRVSFSGCEGFELHVDQQHSPAVHGLIWDHPKSQELGLSHFGGQALNSLRLERGFLLRGDLDYVHYTEANLGRFVASKKKDFMGKDESYQPEKQAAIFRVQTGQGMEWSVPSDCPVRTVKDDALVGYTTSGGYGAMSKKTIAMGYMLGDTPMDQLSKQEYYVECYGNKWDLEVLESPPFPMQMPKVNK